MQTPMPVQLDEWIKTAQNKKAPHDLRKISILHLSNIHAILDDILKENARYLNTQLKPNKSLRVMRR